MNQSELYKKRSTTTFTNFFTPTTTLTASKSSRLIQRFNKGGRGSNSLSRGSSLAKLPSNRLHNYQSLTKLNNTFNNEILDQSTYQAGGKASPIKIGPNFFTNNIYSTSNSGILTNNSSKTMINVNPVNKY